MHTQDGQVGSCKPPVHSRSKESDTDNRGGRRKKATAVEDFDTQAQEKLQQKVEIKEGGKVKKVTNLEASAKSTLVLASQGNAKALKKVRKVLDMQKALKAKKRLQAVDAARAEATSRHITRWQHILDTRSEVQVSTRIALRSYGVADAVIDDVFGLAGLADEEIGRRRSQAREVLLAHGVPADLIAAAGTVGKAYDYFYRDQVGYIAEDPTRARPRDTH